MENDTRMYDNDNTAPWTDRALDPDRRAHLLAAAMTLDEKIRIVHGPMGRPRMGLAAPERALGSAGFVPGVPRLGIPDLQETDASVGVTNPDNCRPGDGATALPATLAVAAAWETDLAARGGAVLGNESRHKGFNVMLAGGVNLAREPRNGRNFEYFGEDPLLTGVLAGHAIRGIQGERIVSTIKHYALNNQETGRFSADVLIAEDAARESDLLAFELALEIGQPGSVMCGYNLVNGEYCSESEWLMNDVLKKAWGYPGWVMSDWGAVRSVDAALAGLDQQSGDQLDKEVYFGEPLKALAQDDPRYAARLDDMVHRILRSLFATGLMDDPVQPGGAIDYAVHADIAREIAENGIVLLRNEGGVLPLRAPAKVAVIGGMAEFGVLAGGGSSYVTAIEGPGIQTPAMGVSAVGVPRMMIYHPSSPYQALRRALPDTEFLLSDGAYPKAAAQVAAMADVAIVFATQWTTESIDVPDLSLPHGQDALIAAVAAANPRTMVVLETGGPVLMPWLGDVAAVLEAWYPGGQGGVAIANVLTGAVDPVGRLPLTFPASEDQLPRPELVGVGLSAYDAANAKAVFPLPYEEGADVGYRWFARHGLRPLFPFGFGLTYTRFDYRDATAAWDETARVAFTVANIGERSGTDVAQVYLTAIDGRPEPRLVGWAKVRLAPGASARCDVVVDRRLLARFDIARQCWRIDAGEYTFAVARDAGDAGTQVHLTIPGTEYFT
jgi:beta-glucosidase